ncbi:MAG TPA: hypothetical protein VGN52_23755 [Burkholderiales bacterium]|jgi:hypothetical protein
MGMHLGMLAVKGDVARLIDAAGTVWPHLEAGAKRTGFGSPQEAWDWHKQQEIFVSMKNASPDNPGADAYFFYQQGSWAVMLDAQYVLAGDTEALQALSGIFGTALSFVVESASGTAAFCFCEAGALRREIHNADGEISTEGISLPEEKADFSQKFYMNEVEDLMQAFGLTFDENSLLDARAIQFFDKKDYSALLRNRAAARPTKPWWKFW